MFVCKIYFVSTGHILSTLMYFKTELCDNIVGACYLFEVYLNPSLDREITYTVALRGRENLGKKLGRICERKYENNSRN